jgi:hypothetical protein
MQFNTLNNKKIVNGKVKFAKPTLVFLDTNETIEEHIVTEDQVGRIDLISLLYYRSANYCDYILKWNGISNPFSIKFGDVLNIPNNREALKVVKEIKVLNSSTGLTNASNEASIRDQFIDTKRLPVKDAKRIEYLQRKANQKPNGAKQILPPNILKEGETNIKIGNGQIVI